MPRLVYKFLICLFICYFVHIVTCCTWGRSSHLKIQTHTCFVLNWHVLLATFPESQGGSTQYIWSWKLRQEDYTHQSSPCPCSPPSSLSSSIFRPLPPFQSLFSHPSLNPIWHKWPSLCPKSVPETKVFIPSVFRHQKHCCPVIAQKCSSNVLLCNRTEHSVAILAILAILATHDQCSWPLTTVWWDVPRASSFFNLESE